MTALKSLAHALGGDVVADHVMAPGPKHSPRDRSMAVWIDPTVPSGIRVHSHAGDDWRDCLDHVLDRLGGQPERRRQPARPEPTPAPDDAERIARAMKLWREAVPAAGTVAERYLAGRGLALPNRAEEALRYHPACPFRIEGGRTARLPAMLALMRDIATNELCGLHRTALRADGSSGKAEIDRPKRMLGRAKGAVIKLSADDEVEAGLGLVEGIETGLAVLGAGWRPVWACGSAGAIANFPTLPGIECLTIFSDHDAAGLTAAREAQSRWQGAGREAWIEPAPEVRHGP